MTSGTLTFRGRGTMASSDGFWRWVPPGMVRGCMAEFAACLALADSPDRLPPRDTVSGALLLGSGARVMVRQASVSSCWDPVLAAEQVLFDIRRPLSLDPETGSLSLAGHGCDLFVLCLDASLSADADPLGLGDLEFYVVPSSSLPNASSLTLSEAIRLAVDKADFGTLRAAVSRAFFGGVEP